MAICNGDWINSVIKHRDGSEEQDGTIVVAEGVGGVLTGKHQKTDQDIIGRCTGGVKPHIRFARMDDDGCILIYDGFATRVTSPVEKLEIKPGDGTVTKICLLGELIAREVRLAAPDDWTAEKTT